MMTFTLFGLTLGITTNPFLLTTAGLGLAFIGTVLYLGNKVKKFA